MESEKSAKLSSAYPMKSEDGPDSYAKTSTSQESIYAILLLIDNDRNAVLPSLRNVSSYFVARKMEAEKSANLPAAYPMKSGDGPDSYAKTSTSLRVVIDFTKELIKKEVAETLDLTFSSTSPAKFFSIADLGCSAGPNTFSAVENIIEAVEMKFQSQGLTSKTPEFQVYFNDHTSNDFNMLFKSLSPNRRYCAAGVPGSFHGRIFPEASLNFVHSSFSIHWLSQVPKEVIDKNSPAWNKGRVHYSNSREEVKKAYKAQYEKDMEDFLKARAQEVVSGGLMVLIILGIANGINPSEAGGNKGFDLIGSCLMDLVKKGIVSEEKVDSFNIPTYLMSPNEFEEVVKRNGSFRAERIQVLPHVKVNGVSLNAHQVTYCVRSTLGELIKQEFGEEIVHELFDLYLKKVEEIHPSSIAESEKTLSFLVVLKRKA